MRELPFAQGFFVLLRLAIRHVIRFAAFAMCSLVLDSFSGNTLLVAKVQAQVPELGISPPDAYRQMQGRYRVSDTVYSRDKNLMTLRFYPVEFQGIAGVTILVFNVKQQKSLVNAWIHQDPFRFDPRLPSDPDSLAPSLWVTIEREQLLTIVEKLADQYGDYKGSRQGEKRENFVWVTKTARRLLSYDEGEISYYLTVP